MLRHHEFWCRVPGGKELSHIAISITLRFFALSLISLFIPLYLYHELGYSLTQTLLFFIFYSLIFAVFTPIAAAFAARFGVKHAVLFSLPFYVAFLAGLSLLKTVAIPLVVLSSLVGISLAFYWMGMNLLFYHASDQKHRGEEVGKVSFYKILATVAGPLLGGLLISLVGFRIVFVIACVILIGSAAILFLRKETHIRYHFSFKEVLAKDHWKDSFFFMSKGTDSMATSVLWPLLIFFILGDYFSLGIAEAVLAGGSAVLMWIIGKYSDHMNKHTLIHVMGVLESLAWVARAFVATPFHVFAVSIIGAIINGVRIPPLEAVEFDKARGHSVSYFVSREVFICLGRVLMLSFVLLIGSIQGGVLFQAFSGLAALLF
ncbi:MFS transporter [Candidatus Woesearchaeota archaeon]|nr:MFS transporter [Candidatus Woesearchaeota archaeon]